ncbi:1-acyl-sn-glycerol-3-phosphate acyltransferase [Salipiger pallidus]|uniref:1-acyl-sn-glycerol-3-phosphate acyltransferase n=1 Tax=Salipiger pallidus TaxID=1775170 RepID=A0A8J2ZGF8_9RHOB|nr:lysophospholipid acyltransferase family protein [Salipiger pallidus]GGG59463.1 1-acyl-sn-glycerol-3-phosphate acyltransferase [Salipiger pallidus]
MSLGGPTWRGEEPVLRPLGPLEWGLAVMRGILLGTLICLGLVVKLVLRLGERMFCGTRRPLSPWVTLAVSRAAVAIIGLQLTHSGPAMHGRGGLVANHSSWLDIFVLNACRPVRFVSKSEVAGWPFIGFLARVTGTVFITRDPREAAAQRDAFEARLLEGAPLLFFPEGTSTDGQRVLPFKPTLFAAFFGDRLRHQTQVQAVTLIYHAPRGRDARAYGWWGGMDFGPHLLRVLGEPRRGKVEVVFHSPLRVDDYPNRKTLAARLEAQVRGTHPQGEAPAVATGPEA